MSRNDARDLLLEFGQWLVDNLSPRRGMEEALDEGDPDKYMATVDAFLDNLATAAVDEEE